ncbi:MAG TPA: class I SAM-dependent methyltransferase [Verrucomicrobiae bacterium]|nr:class I SAM-dependent methyltransferase [Verrucomicrobiae bacterium]
MAGTLTTDAYWQNHWDGTSASRRCAGYYERVMSRIFDEFFQGARQGRSCMEIGCGDSIHLPLIARRYGLSVAGLDFTENGCRLATQRLHEEGLDGAIYQRDLFGANDDLQAQFDFVVSFGLVEHFDDPSQPLAAMRRLLKPGGRLLTTMPNVSPGSLHVFFQRLVGPKILAMHHLMTAGDLGRFHERAGYRVVSCGYRGMGLNNECDTNTTGRRAVLRISCDGLRVVRKSLEMVGVWPRGYHLTGLMMACIAEPVDSPTTPATHPV